MESQMTETSLNLGGWLFLLTAWLAILATTMFCFRNVLSTQNRRQE
jgi:hypothetical protein